MRIKNSKIFATFIIIGVIIVGSFTSIYASSSSSDDDKDLKTYIKIQWLVVKST